MKNNNINIELVTQRAKSIVQTIEKEIDLLEQVKYLKMEKNGQLNTIGEELLGGAFTEELVHIGEMVESNLDGYQKNLENINSTVYHLQRDLRYKRGLYTKLVAAAQAAKVVA